MISLSALGTASAAAWSRFTHLLAVWGEEQAKALGTGHGDHPLDEQELAMRVLMTHWF